MSRARPLSFELTPVPKFPNIKIDDSARLDSGLPFERGGNARKRFAKTAGRVSTGWARGGGPSGTSALAAPDARALKAPRQLLVGKGIDTEQPTEGEQTVAYATKQSGSCARGLEPRARFLGSGDRSQYRHCSCNAVRRLDERLYLPGHDRRRHGGAEFHRERHARRHDCDQLQRTPGQHQPGHRARQPLGRDRRHR